MAKRAYRMRSKERTTSACAYLGAVLPLWGILMAWVIRESWRERSRHVTFHSTQAIWSQVCLLAAFVVYAIGRLGLNVLSELGDPGSKLSELIALLQRANDWIILGLAAVYVLVCVGSAWLVLDGHRVRHPIIGRRIHDQEYGEE